MARYRTLTNLIADVRSRTNMEGSTFVLDSEITEWLNQSIAELQVKLTINQGQPHFRSFTDIAVTPPTALYALPADFWAVQEVTGTANGVTGTLQPFMASERGPLTNTLISNAFSVARYRVQAGNIEFQPAHEAFTATLFYTPTQTRLAIGSDAWDGFNGYEMAPIYDACAQVMSKEETDPSYFLAQRDRIHAHIATAAAHRDMSSPERVQDVTGGLYDGADFGWWR